MKDDKSKDDFLVRDEDQWLQECWSLYRHIDIPDDPDQCWTWKGPKNGGYGQLWFRGKRRPSHRVSWELHNQRPIPEGHVVRHMCHNPICQNYRHLEIGTQKDNMQDMKEAGREGFVRKITPELMKIIRNSSMKGVDLAKKYNISQSAISMIRNGKRPIK